MSTALLFSLYISIAFICYFIAVYFNMVNKCNNTDIIIGCILWLGTGTIAIGVFSIIIIVAIPIGIAHLSFQGVRLLAEKARGE